MLIFALVLAAFPMAASAYGVDLVTRIMIYAIFALSLELLAGQTGLVSLGHAAYFGIAGYAAVLLSPPDAAASLWWLLPASIATAALYALFVGALSLRTRGIYFIMVTLAFAQMAYYVFHDTPLGRGTDGIYLNVRPIAAAGPLVVDMANANAYYYFVLALLSVTFVFLGMLMRSRFGRALAGIRVREQRMRALGFSTYAYKLAAFVLAGALGGLAGFLFVVKDGYVNPELLSWHLSGAGLIMILLGGLGHLRGAVLGAFAFVLVQELVQLPALFGNFVEHWQLSFGIFIIVSVALFPRGLFGMLAWPRVPRQRKPRVD